MPRGFQKGHTPVTKGRKLGRTCSVPKCHKEHEGLGYCRSHRRKFLKWGDPTFSHCRAYGTGTINSEGYVRLSINNQMILEHRYVMEQSLGRKLLANENVHHINGNKSDNRIENLELWVTNQPPGQRPADLVAYAKAIMAQYEPQELRGYYDLATQGQ